MKKYLKYVTTIILLLVLFNTIKSVNSLTTATDRIKNAKLELESVKKENIKIKKAIDEAKSDAYIQKVAIEKLNLSKPEDKILIMDFHKELDPINLSGHDSVIIKSNLQKWIVYMHLEYLYYAFTAHYLWGDK